MLLRDLSALVPGRVVLIERLVCAVLADGHVLLEGPPGLAKTRLANLLANAFDAPFQRIQFTPDLLPSDLTGTSIYDPNEHNFDFHPGPLFSSFILADEINRAPAKVQAALLEAMEERQITAGGESRALKQPFFVVATQNPIEEEGTYELPAAQLDRFYMRLIVDYPDLITEKTILGIVMSEKQRSSLSANTNPAKQSGLTPISASDLADAQRSVLQVFLSEPVTDYIVQLVGATRGNTPDVEDIVQHIAHPVSPRGTVALARLCQARAWLDGRDYVMPDDVQALASDVLSHRIRLTNRAQAEGILVNDLVAGLMQRVVVV